MNQATGYKDAPFDLEIALKNPDWVYFRNGEKPLEWHYFKTTRENNPIIAIAEDGVYRVLGVDGRSLPKKEHSCDLILRIPTKKMKVTVFVWPDGTTLSYTEKEAELNPQQVSGFHQKSEQGLCTRHEFEVEVNGQP